jgi:hypothetical protein
MAGTRGRSVFRYGTVFAVLMLAGSVFWVLSTPSVAVIFFGESGYEAAYGSPIYGFLGLPLLALPPLVAGFLLPKGFWLWGFAAVLPYLPGAVWTYLRAGAEATFLNSDPDAGQILGLVLVQLMILLLLSMACTTAAGIGVVIRALIQWWRGELNARSLNTERNV